MELEAYNEYSIVQHYSDLTDYISENIYILDKNEQSEIFTENWGLVALGAVIVGGLIWLIIHLINNHKKNKAKEAKINKEAENAEKIKDAAEKAVEQSNASKEEIGELSNLIKACMLCPSMVLDSSGNPSKDRLSTDDAKDSLSNAFRGKDILWKVDKIYLFKDDDEATKNKELDRKIKELKKKKEEYEKYGKGIIQQWAKDIDIIEIKNTLKDLIKKSINLRENQNKAVYYNVDQKYRAIAHKIFQDSSNYQNDIQSSEDEKNLKQSAEMQGFHTEEAAPSFDTSLKAVLTYFKSASKNNPDLYTNDNRYIEMNKNINDKLKAFKTVLMAVYKKTLPEVTKNDVDNEIDRYIELIKTSTDKSNDGIWDLIQDYISIITQLIDTIESINYKNPSGAPEADIKVSILTVYLNAILKSILSFYKSDTFKIDKVKIHTGSSTTTIQPEKATKISPTAYKKKLDEKLKQWKAGDNYKKALDQHIKRLMNELLYIEYAHREADLWLSGITKEYFLKLVAVGLFNNMEIVDGDAVYTTTSKAYKKGDFVSDKDMSAEIKKRKASTSAID